MYVHVILILKHLKVKKHIFYSLCCNDGNWGNLKKCTKLFTKITLYKIRGNEKFSFVNLKTACYYIIETSYLRRRCINYNVK